MSDSTKSFITVKGIGFTGLLTLIFITLKVLGKIDWAWGWVLSPLWISAALYALVAIVLLLVAVIAALCDR